MLLLAVTPALGIVLYSGYSHQSDAVQEAMATALHVARSLSVQQELTAEHPPGPHDPGKGF